MSKKSRTKPIMLKGSDVANMVDAVFIGPTPVSAAGETRFFAAETKAPEGPLKSNRQIAETKCVHESPAVWWLFALNEEIFVRTRLCGGLGRTRTSNQALMSRQF